MPDHDLDFLVANYRRLTPAGHAQLRRQLVTRAKLLRRAFLHDIWMNLVSWYRARMAVTQLRSLDDAALKDIGLHRSGIEAAVKDGQPVGATSTPRKRPAFQEKPHLCLQRTG